MMQSGSEIVMKVGVGPYMRVGFYMVVQGIKKTFSPNFHFSRGFSNDQEHHQVICRCVCQTVICFWHCHDNHIAAAFLPKGMTA